MSAPGWLTALLLTVVAVVVTVAFGWMAGCCAAAAFILGWFCGSYDEYFDAKARRDA